MVPFFAMDAPRDALGPQLDLATAARRLALFVVPAVLVTAPAIVVRSTGLEVPPVLGALLYGAAMLAAGFMLSWAAETAEQDIPTGLVLAVLALVTVLPEYVVDLYLAYEAGRNPAADYTELATANMTGANRMLIGLAWPLMVLLGWARGGGRVVQLRQENTGELAFLALASAYSFVIYLKASITLLDTAVLVAIFGAYLVRQSRTGRSDADSEELEPIGPPRILLRLGTRPQWSAIVALAAFAAAVIILSAEPFAESLISAGSELGVNQFLLIQWIAPIASEAPAVIVASLFALRLRAGRALGTLISDKINQWTLLVGAIPVFFVLGAGRLVDFPLGERQREEFFLTAAQSVFAFAVTVRLRLDARGAFALMSLFVVQLAVGFVFRDDEVRTIQVLTGMAWLYLVLSAVLLAWNRQNVGPVLSQGLLNRPGPRQAG